MRRSQSAVAASTTCRSSDASASSSRVARNAVTRSEGRSRMNPTVSVTMTLALAGEPQAPRGGVEGREHLVGDVHLGAGERAQQGALAGVGVAHDGQDRHRAPSPPLPPVLALRGELLQLALEPGHAVAGAPAVDLQLRLARAPAPDAAGKARQRHLGPLREPRQQVLELGQLDLQLAVAGWSRAARRCRG